MAERQVYTYQGVEYDLPAGLTVPEAKAKIQGYLDTQKSEQEVKPEVKTEDETNTKAVKPKPNKTDDSTISVEEEEAKSDANPNEVGAFEDGKKAATTKTKKKVAPVSSEDTLVFAERYEDQDPDDSIYDEDLIKDEKFIQASKIIFEMNEGREWDEEEDGTSEEAAKYGINAMGWFNWNIVAMGKNVAYVGGATQNQQAAFLYAMEAYDDLGASWSGTYRMAKGLALDPTTWSALFTFGGTAIAGQVTKVATKEGAKALLKNALKTGQIGVVNGAIYGTVDGTGREVIRSAGTDTDFSVGNVVTKGTLPGAALGFGLGATIGTAIPVSKSLFSRKSGELGQKIVGAKKNTGQPQYLDEQKIFMDVAPGVKVKAADQGNTGTVVSMTEDGLQAVVRFGNKKKGTSATKTIPVSELKSVTKVKKPKQEAPQQGEKLDNVEAKVAQSVDETPGKLRTSLSSLTAKIEALAPRGQKAVGVADDDVQSLQVLQEVTDSLTDYLVRAGITEPNKIAKHFTLDSKLSKEQEQLLQSAAQDASDAYTRKILEVTKALDDGAMDMATYNKNLDLLYKLEELKKPVHDIYKAISGQAGRNLRATQKEGTFATGKGRNLTVKELMQEDGLSETAAISKYTQIMEGIEREVKLNTDIRLLREKYTKEVEAGNFKDAHKSRREHDIKVAELRSSLAKGAFGKSYEAINVGIRTLNEIFISNVFSPTTTMINTIPSAAKLFYKPLLNNIGTDGFSMKAGKQMVAEYGAMLSAVNAARKAAVFSFRYERSMLTGDTARFLETQTMIPKKYFGGVIRTFPRILLATDAVFEQMFYRGYVVGNATANAIEDGLKKKFKLNSPEMDALIKERTAKAVKDGYEPVPNAVDLLTDQAIDLGIVGRGGKSVDTWVAQKLEKFEKDPDLLIQATDKHGRDYVQDVLFKRDFRNPVDANGNQIDDGVGATVNNILSGYENVINKHPVLRLAGQLFFRTPIRVIEEGMRLTPGIQLIHPSFYKDLKGGVGVPRHRHARAAGEALLGHTLAGSAMSLYMTGNITGAQGNDYKITRQIDDAGYLPPYSIRNPITGAVFNYRNFDPFSTPLKLFINSMEGLDELKYRAEQGEYIDENELKKYTDVAQLAVTVFTKIITDSNLFAGITDIGELLEDIKDDDYDSEVLIFLGKKIAPLIPATYYKYMLQDHPVLSDPQSIEETLLNRINPTNVDAIETIFGDIPLPKDLRGKTVNRQHTALGDERVLSNPGGLLNIFDFTTPEETKDRYVVRNRDGSINSELTRKKEVVQKFITKVSVANNINFYGQVRDTEMFPHIQNLKEEYTNANDDFPRESYHMRMQRYMRIMQTNDVDGTGFNIIEELYSVATDPKMYIGTPDTKGAYTPPAVIAIREILGGARKLALKKIFDDESTWLRENKKPSHTTQNIEYNMDLGRQTLGGSDVDNTPLIKE